MPGPKGIMVLAYRHIKRGLISKLLYRAFLRHSSIPGTLKLDSILSLFKCAATAADYPSLSLIAFRTQVGRTDLLFYFCLFTLVTRTVPTVGLP